MRFDLWPNADNAPAQDAFGAWNGNSDMARCCINRHRGFVCSSFADGSARKVGLKELWTLQWSRNFDTSGPWTLAGNNGNSPNWPEWLEPFSEY